MRKYKREDFTRHTCIVCGKKKYKEKMKSVDIKFKSYVQGSHYVCNRKEWRLSAQQTCYDIFAEAKLSVQVIHRNLHEFQKLLRCDKS